MANLKLHPKQTGVVMCILLAFFSSNTTYSKPVTLYEAVHRAISYYPLIQQREAELNASHAHITTVEGNRLPSLKIHDQISIGTANSVNGTFFPMGVVVPTAGAIRPENNYNVATGNIGLSYLEWEVYNFGYYKADKKEAVAGQALKKAILNNDKYAISLAIVSLYVDLLKAYETLHVEQKNVDRAATIFGTISANVRSGLKPGVDSTTANAEYAKARVSYLLAYTKYADSRIEFSGYTGIDTSDIVPDTTAFSKMLSFTSMNYLTKDSVNDTHPLLDVYLKQYQLQQADNKAIAKKYLPKVFIVGVASMRGSSISSSDVYSDNLLDGLSYSRYNYVLGAAFTYNLFDLKHRRDQLIEGKYNLEAKRQSLNNNKIALGQALMQAKEAYANTQLQLTELSTQVRAARQAYEQQMALYRSGLNTLVEVTNAQYVLNQSESSYVIAQNTLLKLLSVRAGINNQLDLFLENFK